MQENDKILLDARVVSVIKNSVFRAKLSNGHQFVAFCSGGAEAKCDDVETNDSVKVLMSPYDMSKGKIVEKLGKEGC